jgi:hypothetical protein
VHRLGQDDVQALEALVADIADEFGLDGRMRVHGGSFQSVSAGARPLRSLPVGSH